MDKITFKKKAKVVINKELQAQVTLMHNQCPQGKEWSGLLVYKVTKGNVPDFLHTEAGELEMTCEKFFLMDFGDATFTSFEGNEDWIKFFELFPEVDPTREDKDNNYYIGKLHSHHSMGAFHSSTDTTDLLENAPKLPMFLSLVVNYACQPFAELAVTYEIESEEKWTLKKWIKEGFKSVKKTDVSNIVIPCEIFHRADQYLLDQIAGIKKRTTEIVQSTRYDFSKKDEKPGTQAKIGFQQNKDDKDNMVGTAAYRAMMARAPELIMLNDTDASLFKALSTVDDYLDVSKLGTYSKAFKEYFDMYWFDKYFGNTVYTRKQIIDSLKQYCGFQDQIWLSRELKKILDELQEETSVLRTV